MSHINHRKNCRRNEYLNTGSHYLKSKSSLFDFIKVSAYEEYWYRTDNTLGETKSGVVADQSSEWHWRARLPGWRAYGLCEVNPNTWNNSGLQFFLILKTIDFMFIEYLSRPYLYIRLKGKSHCFLVLGIGRATIDLEP